MGREIYTIVKDPEGKIVWDSAEVEERWFCGRTEESDVIARRAYWDDAVEEPEHGILVSITDPKVFDVIAEELQCEQDKSDALFHSLNERVSDLRMARQRALTVKIFDEFTEYMDELQRNIDDTYWDRGADMIRLMRRTLDAAAELAHSGFWHNGWPELNGYQIFWVVSE